MVPRDTLAYDSEKWSTYRCSFQWCLYIIIIYFFIFIFFYLGEEALWELSYP